MANSGPDTNKSQFFITYAKQPHLDGKYTIFGKVVGGLDVLAKMEAAPTDGSDRPLHKIAIRDVVVYVDPFEEFQRQKAERDRAAEARAAVERRVRARLLAHVRDEVEVVLSALDQDAALLGAAGLVLSERFALAA